MSGEERKGDMMMEMEIEAIGFETDSDMDSENVPMGLM